MQRPDPRLAAERPGDGALPHRLIPMRDRFVAFGRRWLATPSAEGQLCRLALPCFRADCPALRRSIPMGQAPARWAAEHSQAEADTSG